MTNNNSFISLKLYIQNELILAYPNFAIGAVLSQNNKPICFASRTLNQIEINYSAIEKELLAIVWATKYFRPYIYGKIFILQTINP